MGSASGHCAPAELGVTGAQMELIELDSDDEGPSGTVVLDEPEEFDGLSATTGAGWKSGMYDMLLPRLAILVNQVGEGDVACRSQPRRPFKPPPQYLCARQQSRTRS